ncbi:adenine phosphoribosyltransferase [Arthrobacter deserti]|uniref:Adenine phosphoribosyltransferase n=1 Tax=Arthrobacter deserti TaxID=1742687 RepID=A0ABX1JTR9_9MICC|nr:adenine phosphoribosyltransferase [Arthrobacter deserti]
MERLSISIADYPKPGVVFRDLTPVFADGPAFRRVVHALVEQFEGRFDAVAGVGARGFLLAAAAAYATGTGVVTVRKKGKLPRKVLSEEYALEYGTDMLELHAEDLQPGSRVLVLDDVLATGGTLAAAARLFERAGARVAGVGVVMELAGLGGRAALEGRETRALLQV